jgi:hypothetical protein
MPPILSNDLVLVDFVDGPELLAILVQIDGLKNMLVEWHLGWELALVVGTVKAHFQLGKILGVHLDVVHRLEHLLGEINASGLVDA